MLEGWLELHRGTLAVLCAGLSGEQRKRRPVGTSLMSLHGLVRHLADVERNWFGRALGEPDLAAIYGPGDADWYPLEGADWDADLVLWQAECERSRRVAAAHGLDDEGTAMRSGQRSRFSLRWIYQHMIEEYARHNGHADLIRELITGAGRDG
jgi:uncharacterized damage-inducible protein DinB